MIRKRALTPTLCLLALVFLFPTRARAGQTVLSENFESASLDGRISVSSVGGVDVGVKPTTVFGSSAAFGFGRSTCYADCWGNYASTLVITFPRPVYVTSLSFKEIELYGNIGSGGVVYVDGDRLSVDGRPWYHTFGRLPYNDGMPDTTYRTRTVALNRTVTTIELQSWDIAGHSEIFLDDLTVIGVDLSARTGVALFDRTTDTMAIGGQTILAEAATYEARVMFTSAFAGGGLVFDEWTPGLEDKFLGADPTHLNAYSFRLSDDVLVGPRAPALNTWHHVAYVYDGTQERIYLDGRQVVARAAGGTIANADGAAFVGAIFRDGGISPSFVGYLDTLRISNVARYAGSSFTPPRGDLSNDSSTLLLYNFNDPAGSTTVTDLSGNGRTGTLGSGFDGATSPELVADPLLLSGRGTPTVDGVMGAGEWDGAATFEFNATLSAALGGGTAPATLFVMNDASNLYLAVKVALQTPGTSSGVVFEFDNDQDGTWPENGDDALVLNPSLGRLSDNVRTACPGDPRPGVCGPVDTSVGGTNDGQGVMGNNGAFSFYEISHPLDSGDAGHDFALTPGSGVGFYMELRFCGGGCVDTRIPGAGFGGILVSPATNTDAGSDVPVGLNVTLPNGQSAPVSLTFDHVVTAGNTSATTSSGGPPPPSGFKLGTPPVYYEISTTATFSGNVRVCISWTEGQFANESHIRLFHQENSNWVDITDPSSRDTANNTLCGLTTSFSPFALMEVKYPFAGFFQPVDNLPVINSVKAGSAVPVKFGLGGDLGLDIFAPGYPQAQLVQCETGTATIDDIEATMTAGGSGLNYDTVAGQYVYVWKTDQAWAGSCRVLHVKFNDGEQYSARFSMRK